MFTVTIRTNRRGGIPFGKGSAVNTAAVCLHHIAVTLCAGGGDIVLVDFRIGIGSFLHIVTAVAVDARCRIAVPFFQRIGMDALFIGMNEFRRNILR